MTCHVTCFVHRTCHILPHHPFHAWNPRPAPSPISRMEPAISHPITCFMHATHDLPRHLFHAWNLPHPATSPVLHTETAMTCSMAIAFHIWNPLPLPIPCHFISAHTMLSPPM